MKLYIVFFVIYFYSCNHYPSNVQTALHYAGDNRRELEKVLEYYRESSSDNSKFRAACFLITNMPYHWSYPAGPYYEYCEQMDSLFRNSEKGDTLVPLQATKISGNFRPLLIPVFDIQTITADYLIWNIDYSFDVWKNSRYLQHLDFDDFCEYVLPYKCFEGQPMTRWKETWSHILRGELDQISQIDELRYNVRRAVEATTYVYKNSDSLRMEVRQIAGMDHIDLFDIKTLAIQPYGTCLERSRLGVMDCRSKGLPVSFDFTPNWGDRNGPHYWNHVYVSRRRSPDFEPFKIYPGAYHYPDTPMAKVYRQTYAPHPVLMEVVKQGEDIPPSLSQLFMHDVTCEYGRTADISIPLLSDVDRNSKYAYLAVFDNSDWIPVDVCKIKQKRATFYNVGVDILYLIVTYQYGKIIPISDPFIVDVCKRVKYVRSNTTKVQDIRMYRKFPAFYHIYNVRRNLCGGVIEAADDSLFTNPVIMAEFPMDNFLANEVIVTDTVPYRYWRLRATTKKSSDFAELYFYTRHNLTRISGELLYSISPLRNKKYDTPQHICDNDPLTYFAVENTDMPRWVGFDFHEPIAISKIACIRRGDGNDICPGDDYELYYWNNRQWVLHERKTADHIYIDFKNLPADRLYFIKGISRGAQNRTFIYENNEVRWY